MSKKTTRTVSGTMGYFKRKKVLNFRESKPTVFAMQMIRSTIIKDDDIVTYAAKAAHVPESSIEMAKDALFDAINYFLSQGRTVQVPELGAFSVQTLSKVSQSAEDLTVDNIKRRRIFFTPKADIADMCRASNISFEENTTLSTMALAHDNAYVRTTSTAGKQLVVDNQGHALKLGDEVIEKTTATGAYELVDASTYATDTTSWGTNELDDDHYGDGDNHTHWFKLEGVTYTFSTKGISPDLVPNYSA